VALNITSRCQLSCPYCYSFDDQKDITFAKFKSIVDELIHMKCFEYCIAGGEPFLHPDAIEMIEYLANKITTENLNIVNNGCSITKDKAQEVYRILRKDRTIDSSIQISIDSHIDEINKITRVGSTLSKVHKGLDHFLEAGFSDVNIGTILTSKNVKNLDEMFDFYHKNFGIKKFHIMHLEFPNHRDQKFLKTLKLSNDDFMEAMVKIKKFKERVPDITINNSYTTKYTTELKETISGLGCTAGYTHCEILANLDIIPCGMATNFVVGSLKKSTFKEVWFGSKLNAVRLQKDYLCNKNMPADGR
jgi:MoaA/NifB/PqqE/SkfB family radical SAM enzyme